MDRKKFFIFLILFEFIIISLFSNFNKVSAATQLVYKDLPHGCPTPTEVYNSLPDDQKSVVSVDNYAFSSITYTTDNHTKHWKKYCYIFTPPSSHFVDRDGDSICDCAFVRSTCTFDTSVSSEPENWEFVTVFLRPEKNVLGDVWYDCYHSFDDHKAEYYFTTFNIYADNSFSDDNILFLQTLPPTLTMGGIVRQNKDIVLKQVVLLLPIALVVLVSLIGLKKALQMLMNFLRKS